MEIGIYNQEFDFDRNKGTGSLKCESYQTCSLSQFCPFSPEMENPRFADLEAQREFNHRRFAVEMTGHMQARIRCVHPHQKKGSGQHGTPM